MEKNIHAFSVGLTLINVNKIIQYTVKTVWKELRFNFHNTFLLFLLQHVIRVNSRLQNNSRIQNRLYVSSLTNNSEVLGFKRVLGIRA